MEPEYAIDLIGTTATIQRETFTKGKVDEFDESEWIRQSLTNQI